MNLSQLLTQDRVLFEPDISSKKRTIEALSEALAGENTQVTSQEIFDALFSRERLGSTGLGGGVAIPHGRLASIDTPLVAAMKLSQPVDFDAVDQKPVDIVIALLVSEQANESHLEVLAILGEMLSNKEYVTSLREAKHARGLFNKLVEWQSEYDATG